MQVKWLESHSKCVLLRGEVCLVWEILSNLWDKQHIASSYNLEKTVFTQTSPTSDWKRLGCNMYSTLWKDTSPNAFMLKKETLASPLPRILLKVVEINPCVASCSLSAGTMQGGSIPWKALQNWSPLRRSLIWQEKSFFSISGKVAQSQVRTIRVKEPFHKHHKQEFGCKTPESNPCFFPP